MLGGCGGTSTQPSGSADSPSQPGSSNPATPSPSPTTTPSGTPSSTATGSTRGPASRLLSAGGLPGLNADFTWHQGRTHRAGADGFGTCQQFDLTTIGASRVVQRDFTGPGGSTAAEQVATFPDQMTAVRVEKVLESWHRTCAARVNPGANFRVGKVATVPLPAGSGWWYVTSWSKGGDQGHFQGFGVAANGSTMALLTMDNDGQDRNYPAGQDPIAAGVRAAAGLLG